MKENFRIKQLSDDVFIIERLFSIKKRLFPFLKTTIIKKWERCDKNGDEY